jgi:RNA polymerase sigma-70 factor (ECF subfamily)
MPRLPRVSPSGSRREEDVAERGAPDRERFLRLTEDRLSSAYHLAGYLLGDSCEAEDAVQDAVERAWRAFPTLRQDASFPSWFDRIVVNVCRDGQRRRRRLEPLDGVERASVDPFRGIFDRDALGRAIGALPLDQRTVVVLRFWRDLSVREIAMVVGVPEGTVRSRLHYGLKALKGAMSVATVLERSR